MLARIGGAFVDVDLAMQSFEAGVVAVALIGVDPVNATSVIHARLALF